MLRSICSCGASSPLSVLIGLNTKGMGTSIAWYCCDCEWFLNSDLCEHFKQVQLRRGLTDKGGILNAQGMNFLVGMLLVYIPQEEDAFGALVLLMQHRHLRDLYKTDLAALQVHTHASCRPVCSSP
jgi:hypothetical protein